MQLVANFVQVTAARHQFIAPRASGIVKKRDYKNIFADHVTSALAANVGNGARDSARTFNFRRFERSRVAQGLLNSRQRFEERGSSYGRA